MNIIDPKALGWKAPTDLPPLTDEERREYYHDCINPFKPESEMRSILISGNWSKFSCKKSHREDPHVCDGEKA